MQKGVNKKQDFMTAFFWLLLTQHFSHSSYNGTRAMTPKVTIGPVQWHHTTTEFFVFQQSFFFWTRRFDPETRAFFGYMSKLSNRPIYTFMLPGYVKVLLRIVRKLFWKNAKLFLEISSCRCGFAVKLCWNRFHCSVEGPSFLVKTSCSIKRLLEDEELCCWM